MFILRKGGKRCWFEKRRAISRKSKEAKIERESARASFFVHRELKGREDDETRPPQRAAEMAERTPRPVC